MSNLEDYNMKLEVIKAIPDDQLKNPNLMPISIYIQEAEHLYEWCQLDKDDLTTTGLDWTLVEDLPVRLGALSEAESNWGKEWRSKEEAEKLWMLESPKGYDLRNLIAHNFYYAFQDDQSLISKVNTFLEGNTHSDMIQCLNDFSVLGRDKHELLTAIGFDLTLLDLAAQKNDELRSLYSAAYRDRQDFSEVKKIRDQAFTHLKEAVDKIRKCGQFVFWRNAARLKGYRSDYLRRLRRKITDDNNEPGPEPVPEPQPEPEPVTTPA